MKWFAQAVLSVFLGIASSGCGGGDYEEFEDLSELEAPLTGRFQIRIGHSGKCLDIAARSTENRANVQQWACSSSATNQQFDVRDLGNGEHEIKAVHSGRCVDIEGGTSATGNGANAHQWSCHQNSNQRFTLVSRGNGQYQLRAKHSGRCLDVQGSSTNDGASVHQWGCHDGNNQRFSFVAVGGSGGGSGGSTCNYPNWASGTWYNAGSIVRYSDGNFYRAKHENPGYNPTISTWFWEPFTCSGGGSGGGGTGGGTGGQSWSQAHLTWYTSWPACCPASDSYDPNADPTECVVYNGCTWAGYFAGVSGRQSEAWVRARNIAAVHEKDFPRYRGKTLRIRQSGRQIDAVVYDKCADSDCNGCCTRNATRNGLNFLIDLESYTKDRFGSGSGVVEWTCLDCD